MSIYHDTCASTCGEDSFHVSLALALSVAINFILIMYVRSFSSPSIITLNPKSKITNHVNLVESSTAKLSADEVAIILSYLPRSEIMRARVCKVWRDAAKKTIVPKDVSNSYGFTVDGLPSYYALTVMATALPCLQDLSIGHIGQRRTFLVGEDPDEERVTQTTNDTTFDIHFISNFSKLRTLQIDSSHLNGQYPVFFNFPFLQKLTITSACKYLKWNLEMLSGCPLLKELHCKNGLHSGPQQNCNVSCLRRFKNTLQKLDFTFCRNICGNFMDLADFPQLKEMYLENTAVTGDIRYIREGDFPSIQVLRLPPTVVGGIGYEFERISDVPDFMDAIYPFLHRTIKQQCLWGFHVQMDRAFEWSLSLVSPDWYERIWESYAPSPPFYLRLLLAGPRLGWCWRSPNDHHCQIHWLDSEPSSDSHHYETYTKRISDFENEMDFHTYRDYYQPPTEEEYRRLCHEIFQSLVSITYGQD